MRYACIFVAVGLSLLNLSTDAFAVPCPKAIVVPIDISAAEEVFLSAELFRSKARELELDAFVDRAERHIASCLDEWRRTSPELDAQIESLGNSTLLVGNLIALGVWAHLNPAEVSTSETGTSVHEPKRDDELIIPPPSGLRCPNDASQSMSHISTWTGSNADGGLHFAWLTQCDESGDLWLKEKGASAWRRPEGDEIIQAEKSRARARRFGTLSN